MVLAIILAIIGIGATVFIAHIYAVRASKEQAQQYGSIIKKYQETQGRLLNILGDMLDIVAQSNPQLAARAQEEGDRIRKTDKNLRSFIAFDGDKCPKCDKGTLRWSQWGPGPFGFFNAWLRCGQCGSKFPGQEVFGD